MWTTAAVADKLAKSDKFVERALTYLLSCQTDSEQNSESTLDDNGIGFNAFDAKFLTSLAQQVNRSTYPAGQRLSPRQRECARKSLKKYVGQLTAHANAVNPRHEAAA